MNAPHAHEDTGTEVEIASDDGALEGVTLAYLTCPQDGAKGFLGALLVTDARTRPLHFAFIQPIRPKAIQRILYGRTLQEHIKVDVIAQTLFEKKISIVPSVCFVDAQELLVARRVSKIPTAWLRSSEETPGSISRLVYDTGKDRSDEEQIGHIVAMLEQSVDLLDPFERMKEAIKEVLRGDKA